ncbi:MAG: N-6 DNA methylase [Leptospirales bacterium]
MPLPDQIQQLISKFSEHADAYKSGKYNETQLRREFLDPFFEALGWDVFNKSGKSETYKDVIHEDSIKVKNKSGVSTRAPDYSFRIGGNRKFFVEAKKPSIVIKDNIDPAYQLRRYGWSANLPLSVLTDFEEFAIYDTTVKPKPTDAASVARVFYCTYTEYEKHWEWIQSIFSPDGIQKDYFEKFAGGKKGKKGTTTVDREFLKEIENWRLDLAKNIALRNEIDTRSLNYSVGVTIDRILFLRICEDRGIEPYEQLSHIADKKDIYGELKQLYHKADQKYNSGLFHFEKEKGRSTHPDELTPNLSIDDKILKGILKKLYYPDSPYEFSVIGADILGNVYEQFLGKVIRLAGKSAKVEEKPEVKKAGGVYYTPRYIVEYIVENTLGEKLKKMSTKDVAGESAKYATPLRVLDPACGSGSFLIFAYQYLLDWHRDWYSANNPAKYKKAVFKSGSSNSADGVEIIEWQLTTSEKKKILLNNIFGVDIDNQAVEVTKLNLLLKVLENESAETLESQLSMFHERALPDLENNIKCGNSLIGPDFYSVNSAGKGEQQDLFTSMSEDEKEKVNVFDWESEWSGIMTGDDVGFDVVIGNPPYVRQEVLGPDFKTYAQNIFETYAGTADLYVYFIEKSLSLLKAKGVYSIIVANKWLRANYGDALRKFLKKKRILELIDFGELPVFEGAKTDTCILKIANDQPKDFYVVKQNKLLLGKEGNPPLDKVVKKLKYHVGINTLEDEGWSLSNESEAKLLSKLKQIGEPLGKFGAGKIHYGIKTALDECFVINNSIKEQLIRNDKNSAELIKPFVFGRDIDRYKQPTVDKWLILLPAGFTDVKRGKVKPEIWLQAKYPEIYNWLKQYEEKCKKRWDKGDYWWELRSCAYYGEFENNKLVWPEIAMNPRATFDSGRLYYPTTVYIFSIPDKYLLCILNSKVAWFCLKNICAVLGDSDSGGRLRLKKQYMEQLPIRTIDFDNSDDKAKHDQMITLVDRMLDLNKRLPEANTPHDKTQLERQIAATDQEIDLLVYKLYDLTDEEIKIVEGDNL